MSELELNSVEEWQKAELFIKSARNLFLEGRTKEAQTILSEAVEIARQGENSVNAQNSIDSPSVLGKLPKKLLYQVNLIKPKKLH